MEPERSIVKQFSIIAAVVVFASLLLLVNIGHSDYAEASIQGPTSLAPGHDLAEPGSMQDRGGQDKLGPQNETWAPLGAGLDLDCNAIAISGGDVYAAGAFTHAGGASANHVAKWDGSTWSALGSGLNGSVNAVGVVGSDVYVGGAFAFAGGVAASRVAKWDGSAWSPLGTGTNVNVYAMAVSGSNVYVGGQFTTAGGVTVNHIAKWDGSTWSALGSGVGGDVLAIAISGNNIYAGGFFNTAGGAPARNIAKRNGSSWSALGSGPDYYVRALAISGSDLYVGGDFTNAGGVPANHIARWNGSTWSALGSGVNHNVYAVAVNGDDLYVGGRFTAAGSISTSRVAGWNGSTWFDLAGGVNDDSNNGRVYALAPGSMGIYAGGTFTIAGGAPASRIAFYKTLGLPTVTPGPSLTPTLTAISTNTPTPTRTFTAVPGDNPPTITVPLNYPYRVGVEIGNYLALRFDASDPDAGDIVTFSISGLPPGAGFPIPASGNPIHSTLTWHPTSPDIGTYYVTIIATDSHGAQDSAVVQIDVVPGCVPYFADVFPSDYFYPGVQYLFCHLVISGYIEPDQTFTYRPYNNTTRGQFSKMIAGAYQVPPYNPPTPDFTDVPTSNPFYSYIEAVYHAGIVSGYPDHTFHPFAPVTRGQLTKLIVGAAGWDIDTSGGPHFTDVAPGSTFYGFVETAYNHGVLNGYPCGGTGEPCDPQSRPYFRPNNSTTRGQIAKILWNALGSPPPR